LAHPQKSVLKSRPRYAIIDIKEKAGGS